MNSTQVITGPRTVFSYANVWEPKPSLSGGKPKYSVSLIIKKSDTKTLDAIRQAMAAAYEEGKGKLKGTSNVVPSLEDIRLPLRNGDQDRPSDPAYADSYFINCNSTTPPQIVDVNGENLTNPNDCYSGCSGRAHISLYAYNTAGSKGIAAGLNALQVLRKGTPLGGRANAKDVFAGLTDDEDDDESTDSFLD